MYQFTDGQIGAIVWHARNTQGKRYGEFISTTGARFTVRDNEVRAVDPGARQVRASAPLYAPRAQRGHAGLALVLVLILVLFGIRAGAAALEWNGAAHASTQSRTMQGAE